MDCDQVDVTKVSDFTRWLKKNAETKRKVALILHKRHTGTPAPTHRELMDEGICYGWIDTTIKRIDDERYIRYFATRTKNSKWSDNTIRYGKELIEAGRMTPRGLKFYKEGKLKPTHDHGIPKNPDMPKELKSALSKNKKAKKVVEGFSPSKKRMLYRWILTGKQEATREKRVNQIVKAAETTGKSPM